MQSYKNHLAFFQIVWVLPRVMMMVVVSFAANLNKKYFSFELYTVFRCCFAIFQKHLYGTCRLYTSRAQLPWHGTFGGTMPTTARVFLHASCCA